MQHIILKKIDAKTQIDLISPLLELVNGKQTKEEALNELTAPQRLILGAIQEQKLIGFIAYSFPYWNNVCIIDFISIHKNYQRQKIGTRLLREVINDLQDKDTRIICVQTASWAKHAINFFQSNNFKIACSLPNYFGSNNNLVWLDLYVGED